MHGQAVQPTAPGGEPAAQSSTRASTFKMPAAATGQGLRAGAAAHRGSSTFGPASTARALSDQQEPKQHGLACTQDT